MADAAPMPPNPYEAPAGDQSTSLAADEQERLDRVRRLTHVMDDAFTIPGTGIRVGMDAIVGLVPGLGDAITSGVSLYIVKEAQRLGVPKRLLTAMLANVAIDFGVGFIPMLGDIFDVAFKANVKNVRLLEKHIQQRHGSSAGR